MIGKGFWQKRYLSKHTGAEIDAAVDKADKLPVPTDEKVGEVLQIADASLGYTSRKIFDNVGCPDSLATRITAGAMSIMAGLMADYKLHTFTVTVLTTDPDFEEISAYLSTTLFATSKETLVYMDLGVGGFTALERILDGNQHLPLIHTYAKVVGVGFVEFFATVKDYGDLTENRSAEILYEARRLEYAT